MITSTRCTVYMLCLILCDKTEDGGKTFSVAINNRHKLLLGQIMKFIKFAIEKSLIWFNTPLGKKESIAIAGVNTTLFALLVTIVSVYMVFVNTSVQQIEVKAFAEAAKINNLDFIITDSPFGGVLDIDEKFDTDNLLHMLLYIGYGADDPSVPKDMEARAQKAIGIMKALVSYYPFPELFFMTEDGGYAPRDESKPVSFENLNEVKAWIQSMKIIFGNFSSEIMGDGKLLPLIKQYNNSQTYLEYKKDKYRYYGNISEKK